MNMNTNMLIMEKINKGFKTKKDIISSGIISEKSAFVQVKSKDIGVFYFESKEMTLDELESLVVEPMGRNALSELLTDNIYNAVMQTELGDVRITAIPKEELLESTMK